MAHLRVLGPDIYQKVMKFWNIEHVREWTYLLDYRMF